jgi:hypothetical protein
MADASHGSLNTWLADVREKLNSTQPKNTATEGEISTFFTRLGASVITAQNEARSRMLDSTEMESRHAVDRLDRKPDGTTVVYYYFPNDPAEVSRLCKDDASFQPECTPLNEDRARKQARNAMRDIVSESRAKIEFQEVFSLDQADIAFVKSPKVIEADGRRAEGYAGRGGDKNYIVDGIGASNYRQVMEQAYDSLPPEAREKARERVLRVYGDKYGRDADIFTILTLEREKMDFAHEIEHMLGAKHPDSAGGVQVTADGDPQAFSQSIMGNPVLAENGMTLGRLDVEWYQRHFGVRDLPPGTLLAPVPVPPVADKPAPKKQR